VEIFFTQAIQDVPGTYAIEVARDRGAGVTAAPALIDENDRTHVTVTLRPDLPPSRYVVRWKNVSAEDGDPAEGAFSFYLRKEPNTVDLANDAQLDQIGAESPGPAATGTAGPAASVTAATVATAPPSGTAGLPTRLAPTPAASGETGDGGGNTALYVILGGAGAAALIGVGGWWLLARRRT